MPTSALWFGAREALVRVGLRLGQLSAESRTLVPLDSRKKGLPLPSPLPKLTDVSLHSQRKPNSNEHRYHEQNCPHDLLRRRRSSRRAAPAAPLAEVFLGSRWQVAPRLSRLRQGLRPNGARRSRSRSRGIPGAH